VSRGNNLVDTWNMCFRNSARTPGQLVSAQLRMLSFHTSATRFSTITLDLALMTWIAGFGTGSTPFSVLQDLIYHSFARSPTLTADDSFFHTMSCKRRPDSADEAGAIIYVLCTADMSHVLSKRGCSGGQATQSHIK